MALQRLMRQEFVKAAETLCKKREKNDWASQPVKVPASLRGK